MSSKDQLIGFLKDGYERWRAVELKSGRAISDVTESAFARYLDIAHTNWSRYVSGSVRPTGENLHNMAEYYGPELYDLVGQPRPMPDDPELRYVAERWPGLSESKKRRFLDFLRQDEDDSASGLKLDIAAQLSR